MRDFFIHISRNRESTYGKTALAYFHDLFPDAENEMKKMDELCIVSSSDLTVNSATFPLWSENKKATILVSGDYTIPESVHYPSYQAFSDNDRLIKLFDIYGEKLFEKLSGNFNIMIYYPVERRFIAINSRLGLYPLYYMEYAGELLASSRLGIFKKILGQNRINMSVVMQHCLYNYPVSSATFISGVSLQPPASALTYYNNSIVIEKYWSVEQSLKQEKNQKNFAQSVDLLEEVLDRIIRKWCGSHQKAGISLTGGWDGRLLLAYALKYKDKSDLLLYSHGTPDSPDVALPLKTAKKLQYNYIPIFLNEPDYEKDRLQWAVDTLRYSDGLRQISRLHYLYTMWVLRAGHGISNIMSGIGGSNLLKSTNYKTCDVFNRFVLDIIETDQFESTVRKHYDYVMDEYPGLFNNIDYDTFLESFDLQYFRELHNTEDNNHRFICFLISEIERKYFGTELQSYKHLVNNYSPFFDNEFIDALLKTVFMASGGNKGQIKSHYISKLYAVLTVRNNKKLAAEPTDRGFSMSDVANPLYMPRMLYRYYKNKIGMTKYADHFNNRGILKQYAESYCPKIKAYTHNNSVNGLFLENYVSAVTSLNS